MGHGGRDGARCAGRPVLAVARVRRPAGDARPRAAGRGGRALAASADGGCPYHAKPLPLEDNGGLREFSVVYTDRALNHMSSTFCNVMNDLRSTLCGVYNAEKCVMLPGSGTYGMEAVARQLCTGKKALVIRNGYFSYRWSDIFEQTNIPSETVVMKGRPMEDDPRPHFAPPAIEDVVATIAREKPAVVFAPHVETSTGIILPDDYVKAVADAVHSVGGVFVLDCIASGTAWVDMQATGADVVISAPQKGWTGPACIGIAMLSPRAVEAVNNTTSTSMVLNLKKWLAVADAYENGGFMYYTTMPTDAMVLFNKAAQETKKYGFERVKNEFWELGMETRAMMKGKGFKSVAAPGYEAPGVVVSYTDDPNMFAKFKGIGFQIAAGVPFMIDEPAGNHTFRIGLFGLDKVYGKAEHIATLADALDRVMADADGAKAASA